MESKITVELFNGEFEKCKSQLKSFILRITASVPDTEDILQDTYIRGIEKLNTFEERSSLKTWLFAIASNLTKDNIRAKKRWTERVTEISREAALSNRHFLSESMQIRTTSLRDSLKSGNILRFVSPAFPNPFHWNSRFVFY